MGFLSDDDREKLKPSELLPYDTPIPTQVVSSDEFYPYPQTEKQRELQARLLDLADGLAKKQGLSRRRFFQTAAGMAASYVAMNETFGNFFDATHAEAATPAMADERADSLKDQFIMDMHTHFLRDDTRIKNFVAMRAAVGKAGWNKDLVEQGTDHRRSEIRQLRQGSLPRQRQQDRPDLVGAVRHRAGLVPHQRADGGRARQGEHSASARGGCSRTPSSRRASRAGWKRSMPRSRSSRNR